jgi:multidrug efflux pump subunit AcrB
VGDIQVNLTDKSARDRKSHEIAGGMRKHLQAIGTRLGANVKLVEVPPGPPVMSPLVAEIYGLDYEGQIRVASEVRKVFEQTPDIVDVDDSVEVDAPRKVVRVDRNRAALLGVSQQAVSDIVQAALQGDDVGYLHGVRMKYPVPIRLEFPVEEKADLEAVLRMRVQGDRGLVPLSEVVQVVSTRREQSIYHKDLLPVVFVTGDMAGDLDSPLYGMFDMVASLAAAPADQSSQAPQLPQDREMQLQDRVLPQYLINPPEELYRYSLKWDGEWQVTYETFRDMGIAYSVGLVMIYLLVVAQFRSYLVPLIIMSPIPLTVIGVMPGHALMGAQFTATSMIGMIALAGIIVRNSILLVDFINAELEQGVDFREALVRSSAVRAKPIVLTGMAAMLGALFILDDPIFSGLAISLIFGILISTLLTLVVIPVLYYAFMHKRVHA